MYVYSNGAFTERIGVSHRKVINPLEFNVPEVPIIGNYAYVNAELPLEPHWHGENVIEISLLVRGRQNYCVGEKSNQKTGIEKSFQLTGGDLFVHQVDEIHSTGGQPEQPGVLYWIQFKLPEKDQSFLGLSIEESQKLCEEFRKRNRHKYSNAGALVSDFKEIVDSFLSPENPLKYLKIRTSLLHFCFNFFLCTEENIEPATNPIIEQILQYIELNLHTRIGVEEISEQFHFSLSSFKIFFKKEVGIPPAEYIIRRKIDIAKDHLQSKQVKITQLAYGLGFSSSQHFATVFKKYMRETPKEYRNKLGLST